MQRKENNILVFVALAICLWRCPTRQKHFFVSLFHVVTYFRKSSEINERVEQRIEVRNGQKYFGGLHVALVRFSQADQEEHPQRHGADKQQDQDDGQCAQQAHVLVLSPLYGDFEVALPTIHRTTGSFTHQI